jgi:hypothetical protein
VEAVFDGWFRTVVIKIEYPQFPIFNKIKYLPNTGLSGLVIFSICSFWCPFLLVANGICVCHLHSNFGLSYAVEKLPVSFTSVANNFSFIADLLCSFAVALQSGQVSLFWASQ